MPAYIFAVLICIYTVVTMKTRCSFTKFKGLVLTWLSLFQWFALKKRSEVRIVSLHSLDKVSTAEKFTRIQPLHKHPWIKFIVSSLYTFKHTHAHTTRSHNFLSSVYTDQKCLVMNEKVGLWQVKLVNVDFFFSFFDWEWIFVMWWCQMMTAVKAENHFDVCFLKRTACFLIGTSTGSTDPTVVHRCWLSQVLVYLTGLGFNCVPIGKQNNNDNNKKKNFQSSSKVYF